MKKPAPSRVCALEILGEVDRGRVRVNDLLHRRLEKLDPVDRALATRLVMGVLRLRGQLDWMWEAQSKRSGKRVDSIVADILRLGVYQLFYCDGIASYAVVSESVLLARRFGHSYASGFVNAVLRALAKSPVSPLPEPASDDSPARLAKILSHPEWLLKRWIARFGLSETVNLCRFNNEEPVHFVRVNTAQITPEKLFYYLSQKGWDPQPVAGLPEAIRITPAGNPAADSGYQKGWYEIQSLMSILVGYVMAPEAGEMVLDACAGRGGKAMYLAQLMNGKGAVVAGDIRPAKLRLFQENQRRLKVEIVYPMGYNGVDAGFNKKFDRILLDAPCSSLGVVGRYPDIKWARKEKDIVKVSRLQKALLSHLADYVKPGGVIVYAVCTFEPEETQRVIDSFLSQNSKFKREFNCLPRPFLESVTKERFWLPQRSGVEGFFCVRLRKSQ
jgi:16S rRNA (cytosine967-C5)-methyltransferase